MSEGSISQEEIDALLSGVDMGGLGSAVSSSSAANNFDIATLQKFADGMKDKLSANVGTMTGAEVKCDSPLVEAANRDQLLAKVPEMVVAINADFNKGLSGDHLFILSPEFAQKVAGLINNEENPELDDMALSVISELVSTHSGAEITELSAGGSLPGLASSPAEALSQPKALVRVPQGNFVLFTYPLTLGGVPFTLWEAVSGSVADGMASALGGGVAATPPPAPTPSPAQQFNNQQPTMGGVPNMGAMQGMGMQQPMNAMPNMGMQPMNTPNVQSLQFPNLQQYGGSAEQGNIGLIMDVFMEMTVELGRTKKTIKDILGMGEGTIIELDKLAGEPVDILVNHKPIAKGEVVVIDENFGVRVTEILPAIEHVTNQM